jgi:hypothetical protein
MMKYAIRAAATAAISLALTIGAAAQATTATAQPKSGEKTVEEAYLQESAEAQMVHDLARGDDLEGKQLALDLATRASDAGRNSEEVRNSLQYLALENSEVVARSAGVGPVTNNFPNIRRQACILLGNFPSADTKDTLVAVLRNTRSEDPMVLAEAIRSLGKIGINDNDEVVRAIADSVSHFDNVGMSEDRLAVYTIFAISDLAKKSPGISDWSLVTSTMQKFTKGSYIRKVQELARDTIKDLSAYEAKSSGSK